MVFVQKWPFFQLSLLGNIGHENVFYVIVERKIPFEAIKTRSSRSRKIDIFPRGLTHGFCPKMAIFPNFFFLVNIGQEKLFYDILERKNVFLSYRNKKFKKATKKNRSKSRKIYIFLKEWTHGFCPKMAFFPTFFVWQYGPRKCLLRYSRTKNSFLGYKNKKLKKSNNWHFSNRVNPWF